MSVTAPVPCYHHRSPYRGHRTRLSGNHYDVVTDRGLADNHPGSGGHVVRFGVRYHAPGFSPGFGLSPFWTCPGHEILRDLESVRTSSLDHKGVSTYGSCAP